MKPPVTSDCSLAPKLLFVDWLKILANEKQAVQFRSPLVLVCEQKRCSHMPGACPETILQIYKQCVRPIFEYGIVSTITVTETVITKIQRVQNSFIRLALRLPKYVSARLLHEASGLPYVKERLISIGQNYLARMHANPLVEHTINSAKTNIAWDKYKTPISILKPPD